MHVPASCKTTSLTPCPKASARNTRKTYVTECVRSTVHSAKVYIAIRFIYSRQWHRGTVRRSRKRQSMTANRCTQRHAEAGVKYLILLWVMLIQQRTRWRTSVCVLLRSGPRLCSRTARPPSMMMCRNFVQRMAFPTSAICERYAFAIQTFTIPARQPAPAHHCCWGAGGRRR